MYQYSLEFFAKLFNRRLEVSEKSDHKETRVDLVVQDITLSFYISICRGLFEKDKLMYSFLNTTSILRKAGLIDITEWQFFLRGTMNLYTERPNKCDFITDK
jgi:dynein heavy chain, axonemal